MVGRDIFDKYGSLIVESDECFKAYPSYPISTEDRLQVVTLGWTFINDLYAILNKTNKVVVDFSSHSGIMLSYENTISCSG